MEFLLIILVAVAAVSSALAYPRSPKCTVAASVIAATIGASFIVFLMIGPKGYMLRVPSSIAPGLHPYVLGGTGMLMLMLGIGGIIGFSARWLLSRRHLR